jgi:hypothetical protein
VIQIREQTQLKSSSRLPDEGNRSNIRKTALSSYLEIQKMDDPVILQYDEILITLRENFRFVKNGMMCV